LPLRSMVVGLPLASIVVSPQPVLFRVSSSPVDDPHHAVEGIVVVRGLVGGLACMEGSALARQCHARCRTLAQDLLPRGATLDRTVAASEAVEVRRRSRCCSGASTRTRWLVGSPK
jgi:hypothetical protein